jgi:hypothetical protein
MPDVEALLGIGELVVIAVVIRLGLAALWRLGLWKMGRNIRRRES